MAFLMELDNMTAVSMIRNMFVAWTYTVASMDILR